MAQKMIYCYAVMYGSHQQTEGMMYVQARNAERAEEFAKRWFKESGYPARHDKIHAIRWDGAIQKGVQVHNESDIPW